MIYVIAIFILLWPLVKKEGQSWCERSVVVILLLINVSATRTTLHLMTRVGSWEGGVTARRRRKKWLLPKKERTSVSAVEMEDRWFPARGPDVPRFTMRTVSTSQRGLQVSSSAWMQQRIRLNCVCAGTVCGAVPGLDISCKTKEISLETC